MLSCRTRLFSFITCLLWLIIGCIWDEISLPQISLCKLLCAHWRLNFFLKHYYKAILNCFPWSTKHCFLKQTFPQLWFPVQRQLCLDYAAVSNLTCLLSEHENVPSLIDIIFKLLLEECVSHPGIVHFNLWSTYHVLDNVQYAQDTKQKNK